MLGHAPDVVLVGANIALLLPAVITPAQAIAGLSSSNIIAVGVLFVVARGLEEAGTVGVLLTSLLGNPNTTVGAILRLSFPVAIISAFMNNTPVVAMMIPVVTSWSARTSIPISKLLIPLSFSSMLGGCCTLIGTSTNLVLKDLAEGDFGDDDDDDAGDDDGENETFKINMFTMTPVGAVIAVVGILSIAAMHHLLPTRSDGYDDEESESDGDDDESTEHENERARLKPVRRVRSGDYEVDFIVSSELAGKSKNNSDGASVGSSTLEAQGLTSVPGACLLGVWRGGKFLRKRNLAAAVIAAMAEEEEQELPQKQKGHPDQHGQLSPMLTTTLDPVAAPPMQPHHHHPYSSPSLISSTSTVITSAPSLVEALG